MKNLIKSIPIIGSITQRAYRKWINPPRPFTDSENYWKERYDSGGNSGCGSYGELSEFKAEVLNRFVREENIETIIEYGCGDGNQLRLSDYPSYIGFDISEKAITLCREIFSNDITKTFKLISEYKGEHAQLTLSLDVIYHLVEDSIFCEYMHRLFDSAEKFVIIYSYNIDGNYDHQISHIKHRKFTDWVEKMKPEWKIRKHVLNKYSFTCSTKTGPFPDFYIYSR